MHFLDGHLDKPENNGYRLLGTMADTDFDNFGLLQTYVDVFQKMTPEEIHAHDASIQRHLRGDYSPLSVSMLQEEEPVPLLEI